MIEAIQTLIVAAAMAHGVNATAMVTTACVESGFNPFAVNGQYEGLYQLGAGVRGRFVAQGYDNVWDPAQQANFVAEVVTAGGQGNWPTWGRRCWKFGL